MLTMGFASAAEKDVLAVSEMWEDATNNDGSGFYWELIRKVYEPEYKVQTETMPYARAVKFVQNQKADLWVGSYLDEETFPVYPKTAFDADTVSGLYKNGTLASTDITSLKGKKIGFVLGYGYDEYLDFKIEKHEVKSRKIGLNLLNKGRIDVFLDARVEIENEVQNSGFDMAQYSLQPFLDLGLYMAFANTGKGQILADLWDKRLKEMHESGELKAIYGNQDYTEYYPFK